MPTARKSIGFPPAKLNLGLLIHGKRPDGYHDLSSIFWPLDGEKGWTDVLELDVFDKRTGKGPTLTVSGLSIPESPEGNLVLRAYDLLDQRSGFTLPDVDFQLHKNIPMGAGLGGGSADGSMALRMLNSALNLCIEDDEMLTLAAHLGSDCPFFIQDDPAHVTGRGECIEPMPELRDVLRNQFVAVIHPGVHISTRAAFEGAQTIATSIDLRESILQPLNAWTSAGIRNGFEMGILKTVPEVRLAHDWVSDGSNFASLSGTGSAVFGLFPTLESAENVKSRAVDQGWTAFAGPMGPA